MAIVGVLALQGGFGLHEAVCRRLGHEVRQVRDPADLGGLEALILPGGESTVMGLLLERRGLAGPLVEAARGGLPVWGTCAGAILLATEVNSAPGVPSPQLRLGLLEVAIERNAYGSQVDSFETVLDLEPGVGLGPGLEASVPALFIRAPRILRTGPGVEVWARYRGDPVLVRQGQLWAATFHPELTESDALHRAFFERALAPQARAVQSTR